MKRIMISIALGVGLVAGCVTGPEDFDDEFRDGGFFCCDPSGGNCVMTSSGACPPGDDLWYCPIVGQDPSGLMVCLDWGD